MKANEQEINKIIGILKDITGKEELENQLTAQTDIINDVGLDSIQMINFVLMLEDEFNLEIDFEELDLSSMSTIDRLCKFITKQVA